LRDFDEAERRLAEPGGLKRLMLLAAEQTSEDVEVIPEAANQLAGGMGMDLSGVHECSEARCLKRRVDEAPWCGWPPRRLNKPTNPQASHISHDNR
jgi:hypothetical protein